MTVELIAQLVDEVAEVSTVMRLLVNQVAAQRGRAVPWVVDLSDDTAEKVIPLLDALGDVSDWGAAQLGEAYTQTLTAVQRAEGGVYYTPEGVADAMAWAALSPRLGDRRQVRVLDPACGAGIFLESAACVLSGRTHHIAPEVISSAVYGTDIDPVAVEIAKSALWLRSDGTRPITWLDGNITCTDPLAGGTPPHLGIAPRHLVVIGNPPYKGHAGGAAPWIEARRRPGENPSTRPSLDEFRDPASRGGNHLSSMAIYFWRWALWRCFEARPGSGVVAFITPASYLDGLSFARMRRFIREVADEGWLIDISPEGHQPPIRSRIFPGVQIPLAITVLARRGAADRTEPARLYHLKAEGTTQAKTQTIQAACAHIAKHSPPAQEKETAVEHTFTQEGKGTKSTLILTDLAGRAMLSITATSETPDISARLGIDIEDASEMRRLADAAAAIAADMERRSGKAGELARA